LSQYFASGDDLAYRQTLGRGLRMVLLLILPATVLLGLLGEPIARLIFGSSKLTPYDMAQVVASLQIYLIGMIFAAIDFPLNYAFYARHNTLLPALVGVGSVLCYIVVALALLPSLSYLGLVWADTAKQASHAIMMLILLYWQIGRLGANVGKGLVQMGIAATFMAVVILALQFSMGGGYLGGGWPENQWSSVLQLAVMGGGGMVAYLATLHAFQLPEIMLIRSHLRTRLGM
ncbi:MAG: polysaccharide biosynthesis C-terminal domain-containing protein, partial [Caldilineaceae bacterium]|nr:polysaccharide biosynthesis C-terminal domain-containing protein [Caldilineaceae bacterium]